MSMPYLGIPRQTQPAVTLDSQNVRLEIRQQPSQALVTLDNKEKVRKPIDPPPIVEMKVGQYADQSEQWLVSPYLFMIATLLEGKTGDTLVPGRNLIGGMTSSLHRLKDVTNKDGGFFIFGDISVRKAGTFRLRFNLFNTDKETSSVTFITSIDSKPFEVVTNKEFRGLAESTHLSRTFSDQGVRLRLRKEARSLGGGTTGMKRVHGGVSTPPESYTQPQTTSFGGAGGDSYYSYGTPVKRQRSDSGNNGQAFPAYAGGNSSTYMGNVGRQYSTPQQNFGAGQDYAWNMHSGNNRAGVPTTMGQSATDAAAWSRSYQQGQMAAPAGNMYGSRTGATTQSPYYDPQQTARVGPYPSQSSGDQYTGYGLATPTSNPDNALNPNPNFSGSQPDFGSHGGAAQSYTDDLNPASLSFDSLPTGSSAAYAGQTPTAGGALGDLNSMFDVSGEYKSTSGAFTQAGMSTLTSEWSGTPYQQPASHRLGHHTSMESLGEHSSGYPTPQTAKWSH